MSTGSQLFYILGKAWHTGKVLNGNEFLKEFTYLGTRLTLKLEKRKRETVTNMFSSENMFTTKAQTSAENLFNLFPKIIINTYLTDQYLRTHLILWFGNHVVSQHFYSVLSSKISIFWPITCNFKMTRGF